jgi:hypothetical protein
MSLASNVESLATRVATECKALRNLINGNAANLSALTTINKTHLVAAINEVNANAGGARALDDLTDVVVTTPAVGHVLRHNGTNFVNTLGTTWYEVAGAAATAQSNSQPVDADLTAIAALTTTAYGRAFLTLAAQTNLMALIAASTNTAQGIIEISTAAENTTGTDDTRAVTPLGLQTRMAAYAQPLGNYQPLDSDLTAIAALTTTAYGQNLLTLANQAALQTAVGASTLTNSGVIELATQAEVDAGVDAVRAVAPSTLASRLSAYAQPLDSDLTAIAALNTTAYGQNLLTLANQAALMALLAPATQTVAGISRTSTAAENTAGTLDTAFVSPLGLQTRMAAYVLATSQPLDSDLTAIAALTTQTFGRSLLTAVDATAARTLIAAAATVHTHVLGDLPDAWTKQSVRAATTVNIALSGPQTIDTISVVAGDRVLVKNQTTTANNGIYLVAAGTWTRSLDADVASECAGATVNVDQGTQRGQLWTTTFGSTDTLGTTAMNWYRDVDASMIGAVNGIAGLDGAGQVPVAQLPNDARYQPSDSDLTAIAALSTTTYGRSLLTAVDATAGRTLLNAETAGAAAAAQAASQPLDSDLTAIAALTTTAYGRGFLALTAQAGLMALIAQGTTAVQGILQLATNVEATTGTDTAKAVTAAGVAAVFTARIDTNVNLGASNVNVPSQAAVKAYADALIGANDAMVYKGVINASTNPNYPAGNAGDTWRISVAGKVGGASGTNVEIGDMISCLVDGSAAGTQAVVGANWNIIQANLDGAVIGPVSAVSGNFATYSGTSGKIIQDSLLALDTDGALTANSDLKIPSQKAVKTYAQPLNANLTSLAAVASTAYGRGFLPLVDATAARAYISTYSQSEIGDPTTDFVASFNAGLV